MRCHQQKHHYHHRTTMTATSLPNTRRGRRAVTLGLMLSLVGVDVSSAFQQQHPQQQQQYDGSARHVQSPKTRHQSVPTMIMSQRRHCHRRSGRALDLERRDPYRSFASKERDGVVDEEVQRSTRTPLQLHAERLSRFLVSTLLAFMTTTISTTIPFHSLNQQDHSYSTTSPNPTVLVANAAGYGSLTPEQKFVAEAWRTVDSTFLDRTFAGQDWFKTRQDLINRKYRSMDEAQQAVADMMATLGDKYTRYLSPAKYQSLVDSATGTLAGIGVEIGTTTDGYPVVGDVEPDSPASKAGVLPNDVFLESDGTKFDAKTTPDDVALKLRGPVNSKVGLTVLRNGQQKEFILTRQPIQVTSVRSYMGTNKVGVIRIKNFSATTGSLVKDAMTTLKKQGAKSFLFDLRGNPGGLLPGGIETASLFLESNKPVVFVVSNKGVVSAEETFADGIDTTTPITVLVDHNTASAAEVFTAALKENGRATIVGEQTFGKGIIQTIRELSDQNGGVAVTVARYETPNHNDINKAGIAVDETTNVDCAKDDATACVPSKLLL